MPIPSQLNFCDLATHYDALSQNGDPLVLLASHIPWEDFRQALKAVLDHSKRKKGGRPPFDAVLMFEVLVLQALYNLSDDQTSFSETGRYQGQRQAGGSTQVDYYPFSHVLGAY